MARKAGDVNPRAATRTGVGSLARTLADAAHVLGLAEDAEGRIRVVKAEDVEERKPQAASIMPADLARLMTVDEFRDLIAFLTSRAGR